jgi:hypothetical protein
MFANEPSAGSSAEARDRFLTAAAHRVAEAESSDVEPDDAAATRPAGPSTLA